MLGRWQFQGEQFHRDEVDGYISWQIGREANGQTPGEDFVQQVNGTKLVFGDAIGPAEIVWLGAYVRILLRGSIPQISKCSIDFFFRENAVPLRIDWAKE